MYQWFLIFGSFFAFVYGFGTGSNDLANAFSTSVSTKTLKMWHVIVIASIFEFVGALVLGRVSTSTLQGGIADISLYKEDPEMYAYGMMISLGVAGLLQILGSYLELNISSTHSIIGCIMGFTLVLKGKDGVIWSLQDSNSFPPFKGVVPIFFSWVISPLLTSIASATIFGLCKYLVLKRSNPVFKAMLVLPFAVFLTIWVNVYFVFTKGAKKMLDTKNDWSDHKAALIALYTAICASGVSAVLLPWIQKKMQTRFDITRNTSNIELNIVPAESIIQKAVQFVKDKTEFNIEEEIQDDELVAKIHKNAEIFNPQAEFVFSYLQVFSAICVIFSHGAGEVGYMSGPLSAIWEFYKHGQVVKKMVPPIWVILIGAFGLITGLTLYGQKLTKAMAIKLSKLSPSRGFAAELATSLVIMVASQFGLPTSSSQCIVGGIIGVGLLEGVNGVNWKYFSSLFTSWIINLFLSMGLVALFFAQGVYSPSVYQSQEIHFYEKQITYVTKHLLTSCNRSSKALNMHTPSEFMYGLNTTVLLYTNRTCPN